MKRLIIITILLFAATALVTVVYFRHLNTSGKYANLAMRTIPNDASLIFEFNNDKEFYDIFAGSKLFGNLLGQDNQDELTALQQLLLQNPVLKKYFSGQDIFVSLHPQKNNSIDFLLTVSASKEFSEAVLEQLSKQPKNGMLITPTEFDGRPGYIIYLNDLKKRFYVINKDDYCLSGSFSKDIITHCANYDYRREKQSFVLLPDQQRSNSLANLYLNYRALTPLVEQVFLSKNYDIVKNFRQFPGLAALSLNFKGDALIFNGTSEAENSGSEGYLGLFGGQQPVANHLKELFPSTTAYFTNFSVSDPLKFESELADLESKSDFSAQRGDILSKIRKETGISLQKEFPRLLGNEFAVVTTHYHEKIGIVQLKDGSKLLSLLTNTCKMSSDNTGQFTYDNVPQILLGEAFSQFKKPYFKVLDNYLILTNSTSEIVSYTDTYVNRKFLVKTNGYNDFNNLLAESSNVSFFIQFKNAAQLFKQDMKLSFYESFDQANPGWKNFYGASWQLSSSDKSFYTNFCMRLNTDTASIKGAF
ncbi:hypothetical protein [Mucilaginibacter sp.]|jgi:hypothetical protein|uniref:hypothetical protein n=1 Tax=Mucilaginibacter sp. TaxID=1882438 RepID=UPI002D07C7F3|nr:hypothetical protein [Mucilaginibacter sp.]HTI59367.1 hypothetical protein [Mucilaginibacter sp.]